ncbi:MAG: pseudouridine synthase [Eubacterium sp.]|nr:pseudouridine synthase [Eubacterium sp.]
MGDEELIRINKYLSAAGFCSRRKADSLIEAGRVTVDGQTAEAGMKISPGAVVAVDGVPVKEEEEEILIAFNKPRGIVTTCGHYKDNIIDYINYPKRIYPIGRLDKDSTGLILLTNRGDLVNGILKSVNYHEKEYVVKVNKDIDREFIEKMSSGVPILDTVTRKCKVTAMGKRKFSIILTQGLNRQIRRMCEYLGYRVVSLERIRIMNIELGDLPEGRYRDVTPEESRVLMEALNRKQ